MLFMLSVAFTLSKQIKLIQIKDNNFFHSSSNEQINMEMNEVPYCFVLFC